MNRWLLLHLELGAKLRLSLACKRGSSGAQRASRAPGSAGCPSSGHSSWLRAERAPGLSSAAGRGAERCQEQGWWKAGGRAGSPEPRSRCHSASAAGPQFAGEPARVPSLEGSRTRERAVWLQHTAWFRDLWLQARLRSTVAAMPSEVGTSVAIGNEVTLVCGGPVAPWWLGMWQLGWNLLWLHLQNQPLRLPSLGPHPSHPATFYPEQAS